MGAYWKGVSGMSFGIFALQDEKVTETAWISDRVANIWRAWPVHCLTPELPFQGSRGAGRRRSRQRGAEWLTSAAICAAPSDAWKRHRAMRPVCLAMCVLLLA